MSNLGVRNNNWLNIRYNPANDWVGQTGGDANNYAKFDDPVNGLRAADIVLKNYGAKHGIDNLNDAIFRFAPPEDNNPTPVYAKFVADKMGINPDDKIDLADPDTREKMIAAMVQFETPDATSMYSRSLMLQARGQAPNKAAKQDLVANYKQQTSRPTTKAPGKQSSKTVDLVSGFRQFGASPGLALGAVRSMQNQSDNMIDGLRTGQLQTDSEAFAPSGLIESFRRGVTSGAQGISADLTYFGAAVDALQGDKEGVANSIENARILEEFAAIPMQGMQTFGEFVDEPTIGGALEQAASGTGQILPSLVSTVTGAGLGSLAMVLGKGALTSVSKNAAKNIIRDSVEAAAKKTATPDQQKIAQAAFEATKEAHVLARNGYLRKRSMRQGALGGAGLSEFAPLTGGNVSEALDSGRDLDRAQAVRAMMVALPQAAIGVFGEVGMLKLISKAASKKSAGPNSVMGRLAKATSTGFLKGGALEGTAELAQEEIAIRNRMSMDDTFTDADANLRRMNAAFVGFVGGGAVGGAGSGLGQGAQEATSGAVSAAATIAEKAADMSDSIKEFMTRSKAAQEVTEADIDQTSQESERDINAQLLAMLDPSSSKEAVWISGTEPDPRYAKRRTPRKIDINGQVAYAAFVPGRGTIISTDIDVVNSVVKGGATDSVLSAALGYSATKTGGETAVFRVYDADGGIVSEEAVTVEPDAVKAAQAAAEKIMPEGGRVEFMSTEDAMADRARRADPDIRFMEDDDDVDVMEQDQETNEQVGDGEFEPEVRVHAFTNSEGQRSESYKGVDGDNTFEGIDEARENYIAVFGETDFSNPLMARMGKSMLNTAAKLQQANPDELVTVRPNADGSFRIEIESTPDTQKIRIRDRKGNEDEVSMSEFLRRSLNQAASSLEKFRTINITAPGSEKSVAVNPVDLMNAGRRIVEANDPAGGFTGQGATQSSRQGLLAMLGELQMRGYEVDIQGVPIQLIMEALQNPKKKLPPKIGNITLGFNDGGKPVKLRTILKSYVPGAPDPLSDLVEGESTEPVKQNQRIVENEEGDFTRILESQNDTDESVFELPDNVIGRTTVVDRFPEPRLMSREDAQLLDQEEGETLEPYDMAENNARTEGIPLTTMNIEDERNVNTTQNRPKGSAPSTGPSSPKPQVDLVGAITFPFEGISDTVSALTRRLSRKIKLKTPIAVIGLKGFQAATRQQIASLISAKQQKTANGKIAMKALETLDLTDKKAVGAFIRKAEKNGLFGKAYAAQVRKVKSDAVLGYTAVRRAAYDALGPMTTSSLVAEQLANHFVDSFGKPNRKGFFKGFEGGGVVMVNDLHITNEAAQAMAAAHEIGHAIFREELDSTLLNKQLLPRLLERYGRDRKKSAQYDNELKVGRGFEEWYADQIAAWIKKDMTKDKRGAKNAVDSHFKRVANRFKQLWRDMKNSAIFKRTNTVAPEFETYMNSVMETREGTREVVASPIFDDAGKKVGSASAMGAAQPTAEQRQEKADQDAQAEQLLQQRRDQAAKNFAPKDSQAEADQGGAGNTPPPPPPPSDSMPEPDEPSFEQKAVVQAIKREINIQTGAAAREAQFRRMLESMQRDFLAKNPWATQILGVIRTADGMMRMVAGDEIADMFYMQSNTSAGLGFTQARQLARDKWRAGLFETIGADWTTEDVQDALQEAQGSTPTSELKNPKAVAIRNYLQRMHQEYVAPSNSDIGFRNDYFPVLLELAEIAADPDAFIQLIVDANKRAGVETDMKSLKKTVNKLVKYQGTVDEGGKPDDADILDPGAVVEATLELTKNVDRSLLRDSLFLMDPEVALMKYVDNITKRVEWNRATKDADGKDKLQPLLAELTAEEKETAESVINSYLGNVTHLSPFWRKTNSYLATMNLVTLLPFATLASLPDFAGSIVQTKEFKGIGMAFKEIVNQVQDREAAKRLANDIGVVMPEAAANAWMSQADSDMLDPTARIATDTFFKWTGLQALTTISREFSTGMGRQFLIEHAYHPTERSARYLEQLGVTAEQVRAWNDGDQTFANEEGQAVKAALTRFVESSVLRPNAAERPIWASDPRFALVWQLKSFIYAFNKVILEGVLREGRTRFQEGDSIAAAMGPILILTMAAFMPLAALGLELREYAKVGLSYALPGIDGSLRYLKSDSMDYGTYFGELFSRAGLDGPIGMLTMAQRSGDWGGSALATLLGPTAELADKILRDGPIDGAYTRMNSPQDQAGILLGIGAVARTVL